MAMVPHERALVKKLDGKPFALLGVNLDNSIEECRKVEKNKKITWRSWFDGSGGPIAKLYNIRYLPTIYVIDHKGVIRYKDVRGKKMEEAVLELLKEVESEGE